MDRFDELEEKSAVGQHTDLAALFRKLYAEGLAVGVKEGEAKIEDMKLACGCGADALKIQRERAEEAEAKLSALQHKHESESIALLSDRAELRRRNAALTAELADQCRITNRLREEADKFRVEALSKIRFLRSGGKEGENNEL